MNTPNLDTFVEEITILKRKAQLLNEIMEFYCRETMTFEIPEVWKGIKIIMPEHYSKLPATPRHDLMKKIRNALSYSEIEHKIDWDRLDETYADIKK